jgi:DNA-binding NarL/FixJ family response regulator
MIRVLIADDHTIFRQGLAQMLKSIDGLDLTGQAADGQEALRLIAATRPDIAVLDVSMPGLSGLEVTKEALRRRLPTRVILLTMHGEAEAVSTALRAGAAGYVLKDNAFEDLVYAIKAVAAGGTFVSPSVASNLLKPVESQPPPDVPLTRREREVLKLIASGLTNRQIAEKLFISVKTVETHRARILQSLDLHNTADLVRYAIENGLLDS